MPARGRRGGGRGHSRSSGGGDTAGRAVAGTQPVILSGAKDRVGGASERRASLACLERSFAPLRMTPVLSLPLRPLGPHRPLRLHRLLRPPGRPLPPSSAPTTPASPPPSSRTRTAPAGTASCPEARRADTPAADRH